LLTFFAAAKKVSAAPHRGNARAPARHRGCNQKAEANKKKAAAKAKQVPPRTGATPARQRDVAKPEKR
jgi:hypothetical protein